MIDAKRFKPSDWIITISIGLGLITPYLLPLIFMLFFTLKPKAKIRWEIHHTFLLLAMFWAIAVYIIDDKSNFKSLTPYLYFWSLPFFLMMVSVDKKTVETFSILILILFILDVAFNVISIVNKADLLGRTLDMREGIYGNRLGGLFAHSFYSGTISICAFTALIYKKKYQWLVVLAIGNLLIVGSWRLIAAIPVLLLLAFRWEKRKKTTTALIIAILSILYVIATYATSSAASTYIYTNSSNDLRIYAWESAIQRIKTSPFLGNQFPFKIQDGISQIIIDENFISESWYLSEASTFGLPYMFLMTVAYYSAVFRKSTLIKNASAAILLPYLLIDLIYGGAIQGILMYTWAWLLISYSENKVVQK